MIRIKGADVAAAINEKLICRIEERKSAGLRIPKLAIIRVGEKPDDVSYERGAVKKMEKIGILHEEHHFEENVTKEDFYQAFDEINEDPDVDGILLLRPLPKQLEEKELERRINPKKDVDGICPWNQAKIMAGEKDGYAPCTAEAVIEMLDYAGIDPAGKNVTVIGRSMVVGKPLSMMLLNRNATVTTCHTKTRDLVGECVRADILVAAAGRAHMVDASYVGEGAVVVDVGINVDEDGRICGDVCLDEVEAAGKASYGTPVPGGVGAVTTSVLAKHIMMAAAAQDN